MLELNKVTYTYHTAAGNVQAVKNATADFETGKIYAITGRSGSGKTTLISMIAGLDVAESGEILLNNKDLKDMDRNAYRREKIGMVFQSFHLLPQLTAAENIELMLDLSKYSGDKKQRINNLLEMVGLTAFHGKKRPLQLSGGEQQRVAIARALASDPEIIIGDEPTGNLDNENSGNIVAILKELSHKHNKCVIVVTHAQEVASEADIIYHMVDGVLDYPKKTAEVNNETVKQ